MRKSSFKVSVEVASVNTDSGMKNRHARNDKWFDAMRFPAIKFTSTGISKKANGHDVAGILDLHGVQKQITFPFTFTNNVFAGSFTINRLDYGIGDMKVMSGKVPEELQINIAV